MFHIKHKAMKNSKDDEKIVIEDWNDETTKEEEKKKEEEKADSGEEKNSRMEIGLELSFGSKAQEEMLFPILCGAINGFNDAMKMGHRKNKVSITIGKRKEVDRL